ncbi:MAG: phenylalanine--tRNA ligase subunit beta [Candidatus Coatesbacteria bacterium]|nr:phenylalanine--tRNA ligase subunit beta [Candidatus Coatesbacteria bacterium]
MKVTLSWLREFVDFGIGLNELCRGLTFLGLEVEDTYSELEAPYSKELASLARAEGFELDDTIIDIEVTPNRPDCLSVIGIAREISLLVNKPLQKPKYELAEAGRGVETASTLKVLQTEACPRYIGRVISGIRVCESPAWLKRRLLAVGLRPINAVVDLSNYIMLETGQPTHCFDLDKLSDHSVVVRFAKNGERIVTLDDIERKLTSGTLVIADSRKPIAIAGVMGGLHSAITETTNNVFLECANFDPPLIRRTSRELPLSTDSSYRFERGVDLLEMRSICDRTASQISSICGGSILAGDLESYPEPYRPQSLRLRPKRVNQVLGASIDSHAMEKILLSLGFVIGRDTDEAELGAMWVEAPSFRPDVTREEDLIEEIARAYGFDRIKPDLPKTPLLTGRLSSEVKMQRKIKEVLKGLGLCEVWTLSLIGDELLNRFQIPEESPLKSGMRLINPLSGDQDTLRTFLLPGIMSCLSHNARHKELDNWLFGLGNVFANKGEEQPEEQMHLCIVGCGDPIPSNWARHPGKIGFQHVRGFVESIFDALRLPALRIEPHDYPFMAREGGFDVYAGTEQVGFTGQIHPDVAASFDVPTNCYFAELNISKFASMTLLVKRFRPYSVVPAVILDLAVMLNKGTLNSEVEAIIREIGGDLLGKVALFDRYEGKQIPSNKVSLAYSITYRAKDRTLTGSEAFERHQRIIDGLSERLEAELRQ